MSFPPCPDGPSLVHIWRSLSGGGRAVDYLRWLSAMWLQWLHFTEEGRDLACDLDAGVSIAPHRDWATAEFKKWMLARSAAA